MKTKEQWINETMESLEGISRAECDPRLYDRVMQALGNSRPGTIPFNPRLVWKIAAGLALLISVNILSIVHYSRTHESGQTQINTLASEYFSYINTIKL